MCGVRKPIGCAMRALRWWSSARSRSDSELEEYLQQLGEHQTTSIGSSLKFCLVAEGQAQLYPVSGRRTSRTRQPGHAVAAAAECACS